MIFWPFYFLFTAICLLVGLFLLVKPKAAIELQRRFYEKINWRIEPISISKEIRNTRLMGLFLLILWLASLIFSGVLTSKAEAFSMSKLSLPTHLSVCVCL